VEIKLVSLSTHRPNSGLKKVGEQVKLLSLSLLGLKKVGLIYLRSFKLGFLRPSGL
jgi:hypothetical protein